jgi:spore coat protein U-like protein
MRLAAPALLFAVLACPGTASAVVCNLRATPVAFGTYSPGDPSPLDVTGEIEVRCQGTAGSFAATLSPGSGGTFAQRQMVSGASTLFYNLFVDAARTIIWGDGTGGSQRVGGLPRPGRLVFLFPIYGRVFPRQAVAPGMYTDDILVTVEF